MQQIRITFKDGTEKVFNHRGRAGGSYTIGIKFQGGFAIVEDEWGNTEAYPDAAIEKVQTVPDRSW